MTPEERSRLHPCVAHRGWSGAAPENTMAAFERALREPNVRWMELDVHLSKDEVPVVIHDGTLKRTANAKGKVMERTAEQLGKLDAGSWFDSSYAGEGIPTLARVLELAAGRCKLNIELKDDGDDRRILAARTLEAIRSRGMEADVVITSFEQQLLREVRRADPAIRIGLIIDGNPPNLIDILKQLDAGYLSIGYTHLTPELLRDAARAGIEVMVWTVNSPADLRLLTNRPEPFQICTNYPDRWVAAVQSKEL